MKHHLILTSCRRRRFPPKVKRLTEEEYIQQGNFETRKALEELRTFCHSPQCDAWKTISRLQSPQRSVIKRHEHFPLLLLIYLSQLINKHACSFLPFLLSCDGEGIQVHYDLLFSPCKGERCVYFFTITTTYFRESCMLFSVCCRVIFYSYPSLWCIYCDFLLAGKLWFKSVPFCYSCMGVGLVFLCFPSFPLHFGNFLL